MNKLLAIVGLVFCLLIVKSNAQLYSCTSPSSDCPSGCRVNSGFTFWNAAGGDYGAMCAWLNYNQGLDVCNIKIGACVNVPPYGTRQNCNYIPPTCLNANIPSSYYSPQATYYNGNSGYYNGNTGYYNGNSGYYNSGSTYYAPSYATNGNRCQNAGYVCPSGCSAITIQSGMTYWALARGDNTCVNAIYSCNAYNADASNVYALQVGCAICLPAYQPCNLAADYSYNPSYFYSYGK